MTRSVSDTEMARRQRVAQLREDLAQFMGNHEERGIFVWIAALSAMLTRLSEWGMEGEDG